MCHFVKNLYKLKARHNMYLLNADTAQTVCTLTIGMFPFNIVMFDVLCIVMASEDGLLLALVCNPMNIYYFAK